MGEYDPLLAGVSVHDFLLLLWNHWPAYFTFSWGILSQRAEWQIGTKLSIVIESESPGLRVRTESECNFPALICFYYLSKAIISPFSSYSSVWCERMLQRGKRSDSARVSHTNKQQSMICYARLWVTLTITEELFIIVVPHVVLVCSCVCGHVKTFSLTALQHWE